MKYRVMNIDEGGCQKLALCDDEKTASFVADSISERIGGVIVQTLRNVDGAYVYLRSGFDANGDRITHKSGAIITLHDDHASNVDYDGPFHVEFDNGRVVNIKTLDEFDDALAIYQLTTTHKLLDEARDWLADHEAFRRQLETLMFEIEHDIDERELRTAGVS